MFRFSRLASFHKHNIQANERFERLFPVKVLLVFVALCVPVQADGIYGTLSNFDVYNTTPEPCEGFEIELEGVDSSDIYRTFPAHFEIEDISNYSDGTGSGVRITYKEYYFRDSSGVDHFSINPNPNPQSTNGHSAVNRVDIEHFGFSLRGAQPTATRTYWLNKVESSGLYERLNSAPLPIPMPTWSYQPGVAGGAPIVRAEIEAPEPPEVIEQKPDSIWVKVYKTELDREVELDELMGGDGIVPQGAVEGETETEWELLEGGKMKVKEAEVNEDGHAVIRRYEYFVYTGLYDVEHEPLSLFLEDDLLDPTNIPGPNGELARSEVGDFIAANMVAANFVVGVPEPGDANDDGVLNNLDIASFVLALTNLPAYLIQFPDVDPDVVLDMNNDGVFNNLDIVGFVAALVP